MAVITKYPTNLETINTNAIYPANANNYFNNFFEVPVEVSTNIDTAIIGYFERVADNKEAARAMASAVIYTSVKQGLNPMATLDEFKRVPIGELNAYVALFLNYERKGTSYLGITNAPIINKYIQRTILP